MTNFITDPQDLRSTTVARFISVAGVALASLTGATACTTPEAPSESSPSPEESDEAPVEAPEDSSDSHESSGSDAAADEKDTLTASDVEEGDLLDIPALSHLGGTAEAVGAGPETVDVRLDDAALADLEPVYGLRATGQRKFNPTTDQVCAGVEVPGLPDGIDLYRVDASDGGASITGDMNPGSAPAVIACSTDDDLEEVTEQMLDEASSAPDRTMYLYIPYEHIEKQ